LGRVGAGERINYVGGGGKKQRFQNASADHITHQPKREQVQTKTLNKKKKKNNAIRETTLGEGRTRGSIGLGDDAKKTERGHLKKQKVPKGELRGSIKVFATKACLCQLTEKKRLRLVRKRITKMQGRSEEGLLLFAN